MRLHRTPLALLIALLVLLPFAAACGGAAEEPAVEEPAAEEPAAEEPAAEEPMDEMAAQEPAEEEGPAEPQIVGNIVLSGENFEWGEVDGDTSPYTWTVRVANDTTATLNITVRFQFLDENDAVLKTETATVQLAPAASRTINESGTMTYDEALKVVGFLADYEYARAES